MNQIIEGIVSGLGGGLQGASKGIGTVDINDQNTNHAKEFSDVYGLNDFAEKLKEKKEKEEKEKEENGMSDILLKTVYGENIDDKIIDNFAKISAISFKYNDKAKSKYGEERAVDDSNHIGVIAQELEKNPITEGAVKANENGDLEVDTRHLTFTDTAAIAELSRRVLALEEAVKELLNK